MYHVLLFVNYSLSNEVLLVKFSLILLQGQQTSDIQSCQTTMQLQSIKAASKQMKAVTLVQMSMLPTGTVLPRIPLRCSFKFSVKNRSMSIWHNDKEVKINAVSEHGKVTRTEDRVIQDPKSPG